MNYWLETTSLIAMMIICVVLGFGLGASHQECQVILPYFNLHNFTIQNFTLNDYDAWKCYPEASNQTNINTCYVVTNSSGFTKMYQMFCEQDRGSCEIMREYVKK
jgi:hypothetical protein